jgi:aldose 1-epimerase
MAISFKEFGKTKNGETITVYTLENAKKTRVSVINYGAAIISVVVPQKDGNFIDVALGYGDVASYENQEPYIGALIGRVGNRIENGKFTLDGKEYTLYANDGPNHLHGGKVGFDKKLWSAGVEGGAVKMTYASPDGEEGYPGTLEVTVRYSLDDEDALTIYYEAVTDKTTVVNLTNHSYFNLNGHGAGEITDHYIGIFADSYTATKEGLLPDGRILPVSGTPLDFTTPKLIGENIDADSFEPIKSAGGFDHNFVIKDYDASVKPAARVYSPKTGVELTASTNMPGIQFYSGNFLKNGIAGKDGATYNRRGGLCLETQYFPNALANPGFVQPVLKPGETYKHTTIYRFGTI